MPIIYDVPLSFRAEAGRVYAFGPKGTDLAIALPGDPEMNLEVVLARGLKSGDLIKMSATPNANYAPRPIGGTLNPGTAGKLFFRGEPHEVMVLAVVALPQQVCSVTYLQRHSSAFSTLPADIFVEQFQPSQTQRVRQHLIAQ